MLLSPPTIGAQGNTPSPFINIGEIRNKGLEIELGWSNASEDFSYSIDANAAFIDNEVTRLVDGSFWVLDFMDDPTRRFPVPMWGAPLLPFMDGVPMAFSKHKQT